MDYHKPPRTHCPLGHEMTEANTYVSIQFYRGKPYKNRQCLFCRRVRARDYNRGRSEHRRMLRAAAETQRQADLARAPRLPPQPVPVAPRRPAEPRCRCGLRLPCNNCLPTSATAYAQQVRTHYSDVMGDRIASWRGGKRVYR